MTVQPVEHFDLDPERLTLAQTIRRARQAGRTYIAGKLVRMHGKAATEDELTGTKPAEVDDVLRELYAAGRQHRDALSSFHPEVERLRRFGSRTIERLYPVTPEVERMVYGPAWQTRRRGILDRFDDALCAAAGLPYDDELPEVTDEAGLTFSDWTERTPTLGTGPTLKSWTGQAHPGHNID